MDFGTLLHAAQKNEKVIKKEPTRCYSTKFEPPKKQQRSKELSENIKRFLAKKEAEEREKQKEISRKKEELLALRALDKKSTRRVNVMLKRTKSANQSVMQDARNLSGDAGPAQPDEDDYGYVSQEASAFYNKMMEKYSKMPDEPRFSLNKKRVAGSLSLTKDRVKAALDQEKEEASLPHKRKRKIKSADETDECYEKDEVPVNKPKPYRPAPPPINFNDLLKIAEKKQFEPVVIEQKPKEEEKRLFTKRQRKEFEKEKEWKDRKEGRLPPLDKAVPNKIPKLSSSLSSSSIMKTSAPKTNGEFNNKISKSNSDMAAKSLSSVNRPPNASNKSSDSLRKTLIPEKRMVDNKYRPETVGKSNKPVTYNPTPITTLNANRNREPVPKSREFHMRDSQREPSVASREQSLKPKQFPPADVRRKEFPPRDIKRRPVVNNKRRILDDDEDYDSEMDDFIDDGPEEDGDYSKYISEIFGYDKSRYRNVDDDVDNMESTFAQQMREEVISTKIGIMEDLEDMKKEEEDKKRKALMKKKKL